jgi:hypothetical protein
MAIGQFSENLNIIAGLGNNPNSDNNLSDEELKAKFDEAALLIQRFLNSTLIPAFNQIEGAVGFKGTHGELSGRDKENQHPMSAIAGLVAKLNSISASIDNALSVAGGKTSIVTEQIVIPAGAWVDNEATVYPSTVPTTAKTIIVAPEADDSDYEVYAQCGVRCVSQGADELLFVCDDVPDVDLVVNLAGFM